MTTERIRILIIDRHEQDRRFWEKPENRKRSGGLCVCGTYYSSHSHRTDTLLVSCDIGVCDCQDFTEVAEEPI